MIDSIERVEDYYDARGSGGVQAASTARSFVKQVHQDEDTIQEHALNGILRLQKVVGYWILSDELQPFLKHLGIALSTNAVAQTHNIIFKLGELSAPGSPGYANVAELFVRVVAKAQVWLRFVKEAVDVLVLAQQPDCHWHSIPDSARKIPGCPSIFARDNVELTKNICAFLKTMPAEYIEGVILVY